MLDFDLFETGLLQGHFQGLLDVIAAHRGGQFPSQDVAGVVVQHGGEVIPTPTLDLKMGEVGLPQLIDLFGGMIELVTGRNHQKSWAGHQIKALQDTINTRFGDEIAFPIGETPGQLPGRLIGVFQG